jgi:hypothetical protein
MSSYQGVSTNNVTAKNLRIQSKRDLKGIFASKLHSNHQVINEIKIMFSGSVHIKLKANLFVYFIQK